ncbi:MAG: NAD(+) synthase [Chitinophagaceae bacterium]
MKISIAQLHYRYKNEIYNISRIQEKIKQAIEQKSEMIIFSSVYEKEFYSYRQMQFLSSMDIIDQQIKSLLHWSENIAIVLPFLLKNNQRKRTIFYYIYKGHIEQKIFDYHYVYGEGFHYEFIHQECTFGVYFFEDIITNNKGNFMGQIHKKQLPAKEVVLLFGNASLGIQSFAQRVGYLQNFVKRHNTYCIFLNTCGEYEGEIFEGKSIVIDSQQHIAEWFNSFQDDCRVINVQSINTSANDLVDIIEDHDILKFLTIPSYISQVYEALKIGIQDYFSRSGFSKAVIGLSGGIDSAVVACIATEALGKENITALLLPSSFSTNHSVEDAQQLAKNLDINYHILPIKKMYHLALDSLHPIFKDAPCDITEENIQSRIRGLLLMGLSNKQGSLLLNTSNKSELCVGYGTLYGDLSGGISVLGGVYKTQVYALAKYINREHAVIPKNTILKPPSAELRPYQKDTDSLPEYDLLDQILYLYVDKKIAIESIISDYKFDKKLVEEVTNLYKKNCYKATQFCDILKVF